MYEQLSKVAQSILQKSLDNRSINYAKIEYRSKSFRSFQRKFLDKIEQNKDYRPNQMKDLAGIRVICYVNSDLEKIRDIIRITFPITKYNDKRKTLGPEVFGYRSEHFIAVLPESLTRDSNCENLNGLQFEIQLRTILEHSWAEIEHDRNYKYRGDLPKSIKRRLFSLSAVLELADNEFDSISRTIDEYSQDIITKKIEGKLDVKIEKSSLNEFLKLEFEDNSHIFPNLRDSSTSQIVSELNDMEIFTLTDLKGLITEEYKEVLMKYESNGTFESIIRDLLIINFKEDYFKKAWKRRWNLTYGGKIKTYQELGFDNITEILDKYNIDY
ncbi:GTP pyrophosphokinase family protein [Methanosarcina sp. MTP4]|uniref:GTP pyrophosphokinase n=1 Tax=Methanosarcina sp. MTP4 TaxID=1434100 RepID=UPI0018CE0CED|nr:hypothetical protein [Methanosarcina sp. MTP4]